MMRLKNLTVVAMAAIAVSCSDDTLSIGNSLTEETDKVEVNTATFDVQTRTIAADSVLSRSNVCYFGRIMDPETGASVTSEFMTQLHILESFATYPDKQIVSRKDGMAVADSCRLELYFDKPSTAADTLAAMVLRVSELDKPMEEGVVYYSNYDPEERGYLRHDGLVKEKPFSYADQTLLAERYKNSTSAAYKHFTYIPLNDEYTAKDGTTYSNYGTYIIQQYLNHPEYFTNTYQFVHNVCPGFYFQVADGYGFHCQVPDMALRIFYTVVNDKDSVYTSEIPLAGTEEVLQTTRIHHDNEVMQELTTDNSCTYIKSPAGLFTEVTLPVTDIKNAHPGDSLLSARISFARINNTVTDKKALDVPTYLLMVPKDSLYTFFEKNSLPDNRISFYTTYSDAAAVGTNSYTFSNISSLITALYDNRQRGMVYDKSWEQKHPDWNKVVLVPISVTTSTSTTTTVTDVDHNMAITSTRLVGGSENPYEPIQVSVVYGQFSK